MFHFKTIGPALVRVAGRSKLLFRHVSPEILTGVGIVGVVVATVFACRETLKVETVVDQTKEEIDDIKDALERHPGEYTELDSKKDLAIVYTRTVVDVVKLYAPSVLIGAFSIACIVGSNRILRKRNAALTAAYMGLSEAFKQYRKRVVEEQGSDADMRYRYGLKKEERVVQNEDGTVEEKTVVTTTGPLIPSPYARYFRKGNPNWHPDPEQSLLFLRSQQITANNLLKANGHIFLNEVYDLLGLPRSSMGQEVGWVSGAQDDYVDFGIWVNDNSLSHDFVEGKVDTILLDFNVDGPIMSIFEKTFGNEFTEKLVGEERNLLGRSAKAKRKINPHRS